MKESAGSWSWFRKLAFPEVERTDRAIDRLAELSDRQVRVFELSNATRSALGSRFTTLSWHDEFSEKKSEEEHDLPSLPLKSMPKWRELLGDYTLTAVRMLFVCQKRFLDLLQSGVSRLAIK
jgi:hypothetical protein